MICTQRKSFKTYILFGRYNYYHTKYSFTCTNIILGNISRLWLVNNYVILIARRYTYNHYDRVLSEI